MKPSSTRQRDARASCVRRSQAPGNSGPSRPRTCDTRPLASYRDLLPLCILLLPLHHHHIHHIHHLLPAPPHHHHIPPPLAHLSGSQNNSTPLCWRAPWIHWRVWDAIDEDGRARETFVWSARCGDGHRLIYDDDSRCAFEDETYAPSGGSPTPPC